MEICAKENDMAMEILLPQAYLDYRAFSSELWDSNTVP